MPPDLSERLVLPTRAAGCVSAWKVFAGFHDPPRQLPRPTGLYGSPKDAR